MQLDMFPNFMLALLVCILTLVPGAEAGMAAGDVVALLIGLFLAFVIICALIGVYARRRG